MTRPRSTRSSREVHHVRVLPRPIVRPKAEDLVEAGGRRVIRAQAQAIESTARGSDHLRNQLPAYSVAAHRRQHVQVTDPTDPRVARVGSDVESTHAHASPRHPRTETRP